MVKNPAFTTVAAGLPLILLICSSGLINAERVVCHFSRSAENRSGEHSFQIADIPSPLCTHVVYDHLVDDFFTHEILPGDSIFDVLDDGKQKISELQRINPDLKLLISVSILERADEGISRQTLIGNILQYVEWMKIDGIELFWSGGNEEELYLLLPELKSSFLAAGHPTWEVNILVQIDQAIGDQARLCRLVDFVHAIGIGSRKPRYRDNSSMPTADTTLDIGKHRNVSLERALEHLIEASCPANKIVLLVMLFAQPYTLGNVENRDRPKELTTLCALTQGLPYCTYGEMCQKFNETEWTLGSDDAEGFAPHAYQDNRWVAYENEASIGRKGEIARRKQLAGVYAFSLDLDDYRGKCGRGLYPLTTALNRSFRGVAVDREAT